MQIRGHGTAVAVVLSVLALAVAGGGTAVAVSSSVNISDPKTPTRVAKVDIGGHLSVAGNVSTIDAAGYLYGYTDMAVTFVTSPTTASLAISRISLSNPTANGTASEQQLELGKYPVTTAGACDNTNPPTTMLGRYNLAPGDDIVDVLSAPITVAPTGSAKYCLGISTLYLGASSGIPQYYLVYGLTAFVTNGTYKGAGLGGSAAAGPQPKSAKIGS